jgi:hypothetical protein
MSAPQREMINHELPRILETTKYTKYTKNADLVFRMALCFRTTLVGTVVGVFDGDTVVILTAENTQEKSASGASMHPRKRRILVKKPQKTYQISSFLKK